MADLLKQLEDEHREVEQMMSDLEATDDPKRREQLLDRLDAALQKHMAVEERIVYPVVAELDSDAATEGRSEHDGARELVQKLRTGGVDQAGFGAVVAALQGAIGHHVEEEEGEIFPMLRKEVGPGRFDAAGSPSVDGADGDIFAMSRDELYEQAKKMDIDGRSQMSKDELEKAVRSAAS